MSAPLSIVIPTLDSAARIAPTLASLTEALSDGLLRDVVISDGGSTDDIAEIADELGAAFVSGLKGRGGQLRRGAEAAKGDWLLFLHADTVLAPGWTKVVRRHLDAAAPGRDRAGVFRLAFDDDSMAASLVASWANLRTRLLAMPFGDQGLLISRKLYREIGGFPDQPIMEDVEIVRRVGRRRLTRLDSVATTSSERYRKVGWFRQGRRNWLCLAAYLAGAKPEAVAERYYCEPD